MLLAATELLLLLLLPLIPPSFVLPESGVPTADDAAAAFLLRLFRRRLSPSLGVRFLSIRRGCRGCGDWGAMYKAEWFWFLPLLLPLVVETETNASGLVRGITDKAWVLQLLLLAEKRRSDRAHRQCIPPMPTRHVAARTIFVATE